MFINKASGRLGIWCICMLFGLRATAQTGTDTLRLTLPQAEEQFLENNLQLLAQHYNVQADSALIQQARLWDNPTLTVDQNVYSNHKFFEHGYDAAGNPTGQFYVQVQQLIQLGGKRGKQIKLAATTAGITRLQFEDMMRNLRQQLRTDFYTIVQLQGNARLYDQEQQQLDKLLNGMQAQYTAGNIALKDLLRVRALGMKLLEETTENYRQLNDNEAELKTLLGIGGTSFVSPQLTIADTTIPALPTQTVDELVTAAHEANPSYKLQQYQVAYQKQNLAYQKSLAVPDLTVGPNYDRNSNYSPNYFGLTLGMPLPVFNRNQGNIKSAHYQIKQQEASLQEADIALQNNIYSAWKKLQLTLGLSAAAQQEFYTSYQSLYNNIITSYNNRQISLLEFIDYFNDYEDIREKQLQQQLNIHIAQEALNYAVGEDVTR